MYYKTSDGNVKKTIYKSKEAVARFLNVRSSSITTHLDKWIKGGLKGYYLFSKELNEIDIEKFNELSLLRKTNYCQIWVYKADNLKLLHEPFNSMQKTAEYFKVDPLQSQDI